MVGLHRAGDGPLKDAQELNCGPDNNRRRGIPARGTTRLQQLLNEQGMSQGELALRSGVARETICRLANGSKKCDRVTVLIALAWVLDVDPHALRGLYDGDIPFGPRHRTDLIPKAVSA